MPIEFVTGDLFANRFKALAHGCNCQGSMGAGIAIGFRDRYPEMYAEYRRRCKAEPREFNLGDAFLWKGKEQPWVFNLGTQEAVWRAPASYEAIEAALRSMRQQAEQEGSPASPSRGSVLATMACRGRKCERWSRRCSRTGRAMSTRGTPQRKVNAGEARRSEDCKRRRKPPQEAGHRREGLAGLALKKIGNASPPCVP